MKHVILSLVAFLGVVGMNQSMSAQEIRMDYHSGSKAMRLRTMSGVMLEDKIYDKTYLFGGRGGIDFIAASVTNVETGATIPFVYLEGNSMDGRVYCTIDYDELDGLIDALDEIIEMTENAATIDEYKYKFYGTRDGLYVFGSDSFKARGDLIGIKFSYFRPEIVIRYNVPKMKEIRDVFVRYKEIFAKEISTSAIEMGDGIELPENEPDLMRDILTI